MVPVLHAGRIPGRSATLEENQGQGTGGPEEGGV